MGLVKKKTTKKSSASSRVVGAVKSALTGRSSGGKKSRKHGPTWYVNKILIEKMKKKLNKLKYGGMR